MDDKINYQIEVRAGKGAEDDRSGKDIFNYLNSDLPKEISTDDEPYRTLVRKAFEAARKVVEESGKDITLKLEVTED
jgi:hypothetical protein